MNDWMSAYVVWFNAGWDQPPDWVPGLPRQKCAPTVKHLRPEAVEHNRALIKAAWTEFRASLERLGLEAA